MVSSREDGGMREDMDDRHFDFVYKAVCGAECGAAQPQASS